MELVIKKKRAPRIYRALVAMASLSLLGTVIFLGSDRVGKYFNEGMQLAVARVLPTAFPFMVISSLACAMIDTDALPGTCAIFRRIFSVGGSGFPALLIGWLSGFPVGAKMTADIYRRGELSRSDAERLIAYSSNASPAFIVAVVGSGMLGSRASGVILLLSTCAATALSAKLHASKNAISDNSPENARQKYSFVDSVKSAAISSLYMCAFVTLFYIISKSLSDIISAPDSELLISLPLEVTGALINASESDLSPVVKMGISAFALGFGGLSVMAQTAAVIDGSGLSMRYYTPIKITVGAISALSAMALFYICSALGFL